MDRIERPRTPPYTPSTAAPPSGNKLGKGERERERERDRDRDRERDRERDRDRDRDRERDRDKNSDDHRDRGDRSDRDRADRDRTDRDRTDRDRTDRDRTDRDRTDRDRGDRDRGDRDPADRDRFNPPPPIITNTDPYSRPPPPAAGGESLSYGPPLGEAAKYPLRPGPPPGPGSGPLPPSGTTIPGTSYTGGAAQDYYQPAHDPTLPGPLPPLVEIAPAPIQGSVSANNYPNYPNYPNSGYGYNYPPPQAPPPLLTTTTPLPLALTMGMQPMLKDVKLRAEKSLKEYKSLQRQRRMLMSQGSKRDVVEIDDRLRMQAATVLGDLRRLKWEVAFIVEDGEKHRWRRWLIGGAFAAFVPLVKKLFYHEKKEKNRAALKAAKKEQVFTSLTEYAFVRSKALVKKILDLTGRPSIYSVAFFVFAVLYIFTNEVTLRVARSLNKRVKRLLSKVENAEGDLKDDDLELLQGWRWRVLEWAD